MRARQFIPVAGLLIICSGILIASPPRDKALWIEVTEKGSHKATVAVTELIARQLLECDDPGCRFTKHGETDLITREMLRQVLDGDEKCVEARDEHGSEVKLYMADLDVPGRKGENGRLILETYKSGSRTFRMALPEFELQVSSDEADGSGSIELGIGWKGLLPLLAREGGALYISSDEDETEVWVYVE
jgi:hypothetical protein